MSAALAFTSEQTKPSRIVQRMLSGNALDPANDDPFIIPLEETRRAIEQKVKLLGQLEAEMVRLQQQIEAEQQAHAELVSRYGEQQHAVAHYQEHGGNIPDCLIPECPQAEREQLAELSRAEREAVDFKIPEGWERSGVRTDDEYVYVTLRRKRAASVEEQRQSIRQRIRACFAQFGALPAAKRRERLQLTVRLGRYTTMPIAANGP